VTNLRHYSVLMSVCLSVCLSRCEGSS